jgi:Tol biopolymer transport system component
MNATKPPGSSTAPNVADANTRCLSHLEIIGIESLHRQIIYTTIDRIEAPNWSRDGATLLFNGNGRIHRIAIGGGAVATIDTGFAVRCNNDHGLSPDGAHLAISDHAEEGHSLIYVLPASGGRPRRVTVKGPSYWHGWSPDGATLAYCAEREGRFGIFTIPVGGGEERRITTAIAGGLDDGPDYSPDGRFVYFNSDRTGRMQVWRVLPDGTGLEQVTFGESNDWFAHPSPDGRWLVVLSYGIDVTGHPPNKDVTLRLFPTAGGHPRMLASLFGGQGTINVPSWSPDSRRLAFVSYELIAP